MKNKTRNIFFLFGLAAVVVMLFTFKVSFVTLWHDILKAGYWLFAIFALWVVLYAMNAWSWRVIIRGSGSCPVPFWKLYKVTVTGFALNYATPAGLMGGEPYKVMELKPYLGVQRATSSVLLFAMMHIFAHFWFWLLSVVLFIVFMPVNSVLTIVLSLITLFCVIGIFFFIKGYRKGMVVKVIRMIGHLPGLKKWAARFMEKNHENLVKIDEQIAALQGHNKKSFYGAFFLELVGRFGQCLEIYFMLKMFSDDDRMFLHAIFILAFTSLFANLLFFLPLQIGGREGGFTMSTASLHLSGEVGMFISIICRVRELFWTFLGLMLMKVGNDSPESAEQEEETRNVDAPDEKTENPES